MIEEEIVSRSESKSSELLISDLMTYENDEVEDENFIWILGTSFGNTPQHSHFASFFFFRLTISRIFNFQTGLLQFTNFRLEKVV